MREKILPAPLAKTRSSGAIPEDSTIGIIIPAAVKPATVADPTIIRIMAAMSQTNIIVESPNDLK